MAELIEITPKMIHAGVVALETFRESYPDDGLVQKIFEVMTNAAQSSEE